MISSLEQQKHELEEKLRKLREFNQVSPEIFKEVEAFQQVVQKGLSQVQTSWNPVKKAFNIPSGKELEWAEASYDKYLNVEMRKIDKKAENGKLNKEDGKIIKAYAAKHPEEELPMNLQDYIIKNKKSIGRDIGFDISSTLLEQGGYQAHKFGVFINTVGGVRGPEGPNSFVQVKRNHGDALIKQRGTIAHVGKYGGKAISGVGFGLGMYDDIANDGKTVGEAISHNTLTAGAGIGAGLLYQEFQQQL
ncbi:hypothetical protein GCM10010896_13160 [Mammaliicoccus stepanovicii]|uniref:Phage protein n=1 Tax=Mammaliicoccus stepanovicii TaxID=643214 RepID=A0A239ZPN2_9STAP|nr:hypothetical protein GCM10010896_13160 [Mammaliicoccus stepanovicii]SNV73025.1 Phage protein [Mammaliicoccus stepanovicii]